MTNKNKGIRIFSGNSNQVLANEICQIMGIPLGNANVAKFSDGETAVNINEVVRGSDVFIVQSTSDPVNDNLMQLLIMIDAMRRASAGRITAVIPYFGYARQDRKAKARDPISAKLVANLITTSGADRVLTMDLHAPQLQGFFDIPLDHLLGVPMLANYFKDKFQNTDDIVVVSPDIGSVTRARKFSEKFDCPIAIVDKRRPKANVCEVIHLIGDVANKKVVLVDDMIDTGGTIINAAKALREAGAKEVYACCTHGVLSGEALEKIQGSLIEELVILSTIEKSKEKKIPKITQISVAPVFAEAIERIYRDDSISELFTQQ